MRSSSFDGRFVIDDIRAKTDAHRRTKGDHKHNAWKLIENL